MISKEVEFLVKLRDAALMIIDATNEYIDTFAPKDYTKQHPTENEDIFNVLKFDKQQGTKLGEFETAEEKNNSKEKYQAVLNTLSKSTINNRYHGPNYAYSYWIYNNRVFRQKIRGKEV